MLRWPRSVAQIKSSTGRSVFSNTYGSALMKKLVFQTVAFYFMTPSVGFGPKPLENVRGLPPDVPTCRPTTVPRCSAFSGRLHRRIRSRFVASILNGGSKSLAASAIA